MTTQMNENIVRTIVDPGCVLLAARRPSSTTCWGSASASSRPPSRSRTRASPRASSSSACSRCLWRSTTAATGRCAPRKLQTCSKSYLVMLVII
eukprot:692077-Prorocentrum_minimum.AAC.1